MGGPKPFASAILWYDRNADNLEDDI